MNIIDTGFGVPTACLEQTIDFYVKRLFFEIISSSSDRCTVALDQESVTFRKAHKEEVRSLRDLGFGLDFRIRNIHDYYERVKTAGASDFRQELDLTQPGVWQFSVHDPNGFPVGFAMSMHERIA